MKSLVLLLSLFPFSSSYYFSWEYLIMIMPIFLAKGVSFSWEAPNPLSMCLIMDKVSSLLMLLTMWMMMMMICLKPQSKFLKMVIMSLCLCLMMFFSVSNILMFFVLFEASLIPTLWMIAGWGHQPERLEASYYFMFYTVIFSLPLLVSLLWVMRHNGSKHLYFYFDNFNSNWENTLGFFILIVFMIKLPLFISHLWLPKAHVEAPVVGSMILASVLLKTGGFAILRIISSVNKGLVIYSFSTLGYLGMVFICFVCLACLDIKQLIAYSSISHMNFMVVGLLGMSQGSLSGAFMMMLSHGFCSSLMFMLADALYTRSKSRSFLVNKGVLVVIPSFSMLWSLSVLLNMGIPPSMGFISEMFIILTMNILGTFMSLLVISYLFLSAFYNVFSYMSMNHGYSSVESLHSLNVKETFLASAHFLPLVSLPLASNLMML